MESPQELQEVLRQLREQLASGHMQAGIGPPSPKVDPDELWQEELNEGPVALKSPTGSAVGLETPSGSPSLETQPGHPIEILKEEHKIVLDNLGQLSAFVSRLEANQEACSDVETLGRMRRIADLLVDADIHHKREEEALFPVMHEAGLSGPTLLMQVEHEALRPKVKRMVELLAQSEDEPHQELFQELAVVGRYVTDVLTEHIGKEEKLIYPAAVFGLKPESWLSVLERSEAIGYWSFTPLKKRHPGGSDASDIV